MEVEVEMEKIRPNIRIEIHNNLTQGEEMEVDPEEILKSDNEEGEIHDDNETVQNTLMSPAESNMVWTNLKGTFTTGINIFDKAEQEKLQERARRFALKPNEIHNFTDTDLEELHESLGITAENKSDVRFEAVHILGTNNLNTEDVLEYFVKYAPTTIEWISDDSCNVTWLEEITAARAIFYASKVVRGMPAREANPFAKEFLEDMDPEEETGQSILLRNKNRIVELKEDTLEPVPPKVNLKSSVDISEITIPIPPGYWRSGEKHPKAKCLLLRFAFRTDKKPYKIETLNRYYKSLSGTKNIISESKKRELKGIFDRNRDLNQDKNPWGSLAKNWNRDAKFCEREPELEQVEKPVEIKNQSIRVRLGTKKDNLEEDKQENVEDPEEEIVEQAVERKRIKIPRMRMYADEEEEKIKRKKLLQTIKTQTEKLSRDDGLNTRDLRNVLGTTNNKRTFREETVSSEPVDLGTRLKNRTKNMVFTVERNVVDVDEYDKKENVQADIRSLIEQRRARSPTYNRRATHWPSEKSPQHRRSNHVRRSRSPIRRRSPVYRKRSPVHKRRHEGTLHSDRIREERSHRHRHKHRNLHYEEEKRDGKPKSKVAVVIKTQKKPAVASTIWSRVQAPSDSQSGSSSESENSSSKSEEESSSSEESESESEEETSTSSSSVKRVSRPGFRDAYKKLSEKMDFRRPLKITMTNDHFKK